LEDFSDDTAKFWEPKMRRSVSPEDARQITENMSGFFITLLAWHTADQANQTHRPQCAMIEELTDDKASSKQVNE
jgi:hypothetical protein